MLDIVTIGETMVAFMPTEPEFIRYAPLFSKRTAGAESNVAIGAAKLGMKSGWISKLGNDEFGEFILRELRGEGVDTSQVIRSDSYPTGIMFKQFASGSETSVFYYRRGSAASSMTLKDIPHDYVAQSKILYLSGITPALSPECRKTAFEIVRVAREAGVMVCFDPNIRLKLWSKEEAKDCLTGLLHQSDIVLIGQDEAQMLLGETEPKRIVTALRGANVKKIAVKQGAKGAVVADETAVVQISSYPVQVVDNIGAGDAFSAGFLCGLLEKKTIRECGEMGCMMGALAVSSRGDVEGLPNREQLERYLNNSERIFR